MIAAHVVWPTEREIEILARNGVSVSHCPESNMKLASGISPVSKMLKAGVRVSIGTDGAASNNDLDVLEEASLASEIQKAFSEDPTVLDARTTLKMATCWGAEALGLSDVTGTLKPGKSADLIVIDLKKPHLMPIYDIFSHIVYSARASDVCTVIVQGRVLLDEYEFRTLDKEQIYEKARQWSRKIMEGQRV
jgi:5-methylthioadenosine/S-adenosylhomocysteine deaminase